MDLDPSLSEGVYVAFRGPSYETPAEIRMCRALGGDLVGMSTVLEAIAAREAGAEVLGLSLVTNPGAGLVDVPLDHEEVLEVGRTTAARMGILLAKVVNNIQVTVENIHVRFEDTNESTKVGACGISLAHSL